MAGQSNMTGWTSDAAEYPKPLQKLDKHIPFFWRTINISSSKDLWTTLGPQGGQFKQGHFGPEITFARAAKQAGYKPAIYKYTVGQSSLHEHWKGPGGRRFYDDMTRSLAVAKKRMYEKKHRLVPRAIIWIQGESDADTKLNAMQYAYRLERNINHLRKTILKVPNLPVVLGLDEQNPKVRRNPEVRIAQELLVEKYPEITRFSMRGLEKADHTHLSAQGTIKQGQRVFKAFSALPRK